jgi:parallel beta-helix repeat protein
MKPHHLTTWSLAILLGILTNPILALDLIPEPLTLDEFRIADTAPDDSAQFSGDSFSPAIGETVYYVSSSQGSSNNDGLSPATPWDLASFNAHRADNSIYLFKRGDRFRGGIERKMQKVNTKFGAYGSGTRPLFLGSLALDGWQVTSDARVPAGVRAQVYEADLSGMPFGGSDNDNGIQHLFVNDQLMTIARYPNVDSPDQTNWLNITEKRDTYSFYDAALPGYKNGSGYWSGANLRARTYSWQYSVRQVTGYANGVITTESVDTPWYPIKGWGYFLDNKLEELDHPGEWFYDGATQKLFLYPPAGVDIHTSQIEGATHDTGINIYWQQDDVQVKDLAFKRFLGNCININSSDNVVIENVVTQYCRQGLYMWDSNTTRIRNNHFDQSLETGINISKHSDIVVSGNTISNNGMFPTYGSFNSALTQGKGINSLNSGPLTLRGNRIINSAYSGIEIGTDNALVERNLILASLLHINDGGAITLRGSGIQLIENLIIGVYGNINDGANGYTGNDKTTMHTTYGMGIFDYSGEQNNVIRGNSIAYARDIGIMLENGLDYQVSENVAYANEVQIQAKKGGDAIRITDNTLFVGDNIVPGGGKIANHKGLEITGDHTNLTIDRNQYGSYSAESYIAYDGSYDLDAFLHFNGLHDLNSSSYYLQRPKYAIASVNNSLLHEDFEDCENPDQWNNTSAIKGGACSDDTAKTGSRSLVKLDATAAPTFFQFKDPITFTKGKIYNLEFDTYASGKTIYELTIADFIDEVWTRQIAEYSFQLDSQRRHHQLMFTAWIDLTQQPILHVRAGDSQSVWIDNVLLQEVAIEPKEKTSVLLGQTGLAQATSDTALLINDQWTEQAFDLPLGYETLDGQTGTITLPPFRSRILIRAPSSCVNGPTTLTSGIHHQTAHLQSADSIETQGDTRIAPGADLTLTARQRITLNPGFHAEAKSRFLARIGQVSCGG